MDDAKRGAYIQSFEIKLKLIKWVEERDEFEKVIIVKFYGKFISADLGGSSNYICEIHMDWSWKWFQIKSNSFWVSRS